MEVSQAVELSRWFNRNVAPIEPKYSELVSVLQHNAQQASKQPVSQPLKEVSARLAAMPTRELSYLQLAILNRLDVGELIGKQGALWIDETVRSNNFDPATTFQTANRAYEKLVESRRLLAEFESSAARIGFSGEEGRESDRVVFHVVFRGDASIRNIRDWKTTASDWEKILASISEVADDRAESVEVLGTQNGSIILTLSATVLVTRILAEISRHIASIAKDYIDFQLRKQELEKSRMMTQVIADELRRQETERRDMAKGTIIESIRALVPDASVESLNKLEKAVAKQIHFSERGGELDFVMPTKDENDGLADGPFLEAVEGLREVIRDYQAETQRIRLLGASGAERDSGFTYERK